MWQIVRVTAPKPHAHALESYSPKVTLTCFAQQKQQKLKKSWHFGASALAAPKQQVKKPCEPAGEVVMVPPTLLLLLSEKERERRSQSHFIKILF